MKHRKRHPLTLVLLIWLGCGAATAQPVCPQKPDSVQDAKKLASRWFTAGSRKAADGHFGEARNAFLCSHMLFSHPASLLNAALASQRANDGATACSLYAEFLQASSDADKNEKVQKEMLVLQCDVPAASSAYRAHKIDRVFPKSSDDSKPPTVEQNAGPLLPDRAAAPAAPQSVPAPSQKLHGYKTPFLLYSPLRKAGTTLMITGSTGLAIGGLFQILTAWNTRKAAQTNDAQTHETLVERHDNLQRIASVGFISGSVLFITGLTLRMASRKSPEQSTATNTKLNITAGVNGWGLWGTF